MTDLELLSVIMEKRLVKLLLAFGKTEIVKEKRLKMRAIMWRN